MKKLLLLLFVPLVSFGQSAEDYHNRGDSKHNLEDYYGAIADYTKSIELKPDASAYNNRGNSKINLKDYYGAIADYTKAIEINPNFIWAIRARATTKANLGDKNGACDDWNKGALLFDSYCMERAIKCNYQ